MTTKLQASLEATINKWIEDNCEDEGTPAGLHNPNLPRQMASAAAAVYDANFEGQEYADKEAGRP